MLPIANPPNSAQPGGIPYHSPKLHPGPCNSVGMRPRTVTQTDRHRSRWPQYILRRLPLTRNVKREKKTNLTKEIHTYTLYTVMTTLSLTSHNIIITIYASLFSTFRHFFGGLRKSSNFRSPCGFSGSGRCRSYERAPGLTILRSIIGGWRNR